MKFLTIVVFLCLGAIVKAAKALLQMRIRTTQDWWDSPEPKGLLCKAVYTAGFLNGISAPVELSLHCRFPQWSICSCGEMSCRATSSLWENSFHVPRWSCSAPAWRVTSRAWNQTSASHNRQTHHLIARLAKDFMPQGRWPVLVFRAAYSVTVAHMPANCRSKAAGGSL